MNVLFISYDGMTDPLGQSQVIPYLIGLSKKNHIITIISCEKKERFEKNGNNIRNLLETNNINWIPVSYSKLPSIFSKQINLFRIKKKAEDLYKEQKIDLIHCRSYMASLVGLRLKQKYGVKFIFDMRGFWADERIDGKIWNIKNPIHKLLYNFFKKKEIEFIQNADYTISLTENAKKEILSWKYFQNNAIPIQIIPCCADLNLFSQKNINPEELQKLRTKLNINKEDFIISYLGSIGTWYMLDEMLDFFKCLSHTNSNSKFLIITPDEKRHIISLAKSKGISEERLIIHATERNEVPSYLGLSSVAIYFIKPLYSKKASSPTKTAEIMGLGIPIITNTGIGDSDEIIRNSGSGMMISEFTNDEYMRIIKQINVLLSNDKLKTIAASHKYFSLEKGIELYSKVYEKLNSKEI